MVLDRGPRKLFHIQFSSHEKVRTKSDFDRLVYATEQQNECQNEATMNKINKTN